MPAEVFVLDCTADFSGLSPILPLLLRIPPIFPCKALNVSKEFYLPDSHRRRHGAIVMLLSKHNASFSVFCDFHLRQQTIATGVPNGCHARAPCNQRTVFQEILGVAILIIDASKLPPPQTLRHRPRSSDLDWRGFGAHIALLFHRKFYFVFTHNCFLLRALYPSSKFALVIPLYSCRGSHPPGPADNLYDNTCVFLGQSAFFLHILLEKLHTYEIGQHTFQNPFVSFSFENYPPNTFSRPENSTKNFERGIRIADTTLNRHFSRCFSMMMAFTSAYFKLMSSKMLSSASEVHPSR